MTLLDFPRARPQTRTMCIEALLVWAFVNECARIHDADDWNTRRRHGTEWTIYERGKLLGTVIDGGKGYIPDRTHTDAETVALTIEATMPRLEGNMLRDAARGAPPDPMLGAVPRVIPALPAKMRRDDDGQFRTVGEVVKLQTWPDGWRGDLWEWTSGYRRVRYQSRVTPITFDPDHHTISQARRAYGEWWAALDAVRRALDGKLRDHRLTDDMPQKEPWNADPR